MPADLLLEQTGLPPETLPTARTECPDFVAAWKFSNRASRSRTSRLSSSFGRSF
jgi:hypothetical protein